MLLGQPLTSGYEGRSTKRSVLCDENYELLYAIQHITRKSGVKVFHLLTEVTNEIVEVQLSNAVDVKNTTTKVRSNTLLHLVFAFGKYRVCTHVYSDRSKHKQAKCANNLLTDSQKQ